MRGLQLGFVSCSSGCQPAAFKCQPAGNHQSGRPSRAEAGRAPPQLKVCREPHPHTATGLRASSRLRVKLHRLATSWPLVSGHRLGTGRARTQDPNQACRPQPQLLATTHCMQHARGICAGCGSAQAQPRMVASQLAQKWPTSWPQSRPS